MKRLILAAALLVGACSGGNTITGTFTLTDPEVDYSSSSCSGTGGFSDISAGTGVVVKNEDGATIATADLAYDPDGSSASRCHYTFTVEVPAAEFYAVSVGRRGELTYSKAEMEAQGWQVGFTLGD